MLKKAAVRVFIGVLLFLSVSAFSQTLKVTLLGTGTPVPSPTRFGFSTLVQAGEQRLLFDFGRGVSIRLQQAQVPLGSITAHFLTHFHSDHTNGLPDLWLTGWLRPLYGQRNTPFLIYGPKGLVELTSGLKNAYAKDIAIRAEDEKSPLSGVEFDAKEIQAGLIYEQSGVKVTAFNNDHGAKVLPSLGYTIEYLGKRIVISGDTKFSDEVVRQAQGADLLIHCVTVIPDALLKQFPQYQSIYDHLSSPEQAAKVFQLARPKRAVFSHIGLNGNATVQDLLERTQKLYDGPLIVGEDLMSFEL